MSNKSTVDKQTSVSITRMRTPNNLLRTERNNDAKDAKAATTSEEEKEAFQYADVLYFDIARLLRREKKWEKEIEKGETFIKEHPRMKKTNKLCKELVNRDKKLVARIRKEVSEYESELNELYGGLDPDAAIRIQAQIAYKVKHPYGAEKVSDSHTDRD